MAARPPPPDEAAPGPAAGSARAPGPTLWAVASGKGGVGKSVVTSGLAIGLAATGPRALAVDLDLGGANLHSLFGCLHPRHTLPDVLRGRVALADALVDTSVSGVRLLSGARAGLDAAHPHHARHKKLLRDLRCLDVGHVVLDLGAGSHRDTLDAFAAADRRILVTTPETTAIENSFHFLAAAFLRSLGETARDPEVRDALEGVFDRARRDGATPRELVDAASRVDPRAGEKLRARVGAFAVDLIVNRTEPGSVGEPGVALAAAGRARLGANLRLGASLPNDASVPAAVGRGVPVMQLFPGGPFSVELRRAVNRLIVDEPIPSAPAPRRTRGRHELAPGPDPEPRPPMPSFDGVSPGDHLRACREMLGLSVHALHERTRIRHHHLEHIEAERWSELPPDFYVCAYVRQIGAALGLPDVERIAQCCVARARGLRRPRAPRVGPPQPPRPEVPPTSELMALLDFEPELEDFSPAREEGEARDAPPAREAASRRAGGP